MKNIGKELVKIKFGSYLYGTNDELSDIDYKVIYLPSIEDLLFRKKDEVYKIKPGSASDSMQPGEEETEYLSLHKFANDFYSGQSWAIECAFAIIAEPKGIVEIKDPYIKNFTITMVNYFLNKDIQPMVSYAIHQSQLYGVRAERLEALSNLIDVLQNHSNKKLKLEDIKKHLKSIICDSIYFNKIHGKNKEYENVDSLKVNNRDYQMSAPVDYVLVEMLKLKAKYGARVRKAAGENIDWKALSHAVRVVEQAIDIVKEHRICFPLPYAEDLVAIKKGQVDFDKTVAYFDSLNRSLDEYIEASSLQSKSTKLKEEFDRWFMANLKQNFYKIKEES